jgi:hypothetical protein
VVVCYYIFERPIPLNEGIIKLNGDFRYESDTGDEITTNLIDPVLGRDPVRIL